MTHPSPLSDALNAVADGRDITPEAIRQALSHDTAAADALIALAQRTRMLAARESELRAVMASMRELLSERDPDTLLERIVSRTHELLPFDVTYLSVYDESSDELAVRAVSGITSPRFLGMRVPAGVGVASLAVRTQRPQWVHDYAQLQDVPHDPVIDEIVSEEAIAAIVGVPLVVSGRVLGVLFGAHRRPQTFRPEEVSLLQTFADHAALALRLAGLLHEATDATARASEGQQAAEWAATLHGELTELVVQGHGSDTVVGALSAALDRPVGLFDRSGELLAGKLPESPDSLNAQPSLKRVFTKQKSVRFNSGPIEFATPVPIAEGEPEAVLVLRGSTPLTPTHMRTIERAALIAALVTLRIRAIANAEDRVRDELATELVTQPLRAGVIERAASKGYPVLEQWSVFAIPLSDDARARGAARLRMRREWLTASHPNGLTVLAPSETAVTQEAIAAAVGEAPLTVSTSQPDLASATSQYATLWQTAQLATELSLQGHIDAAVLAPYITLFGSDGGRLEAFIEALLHPVFAWDQQRDTELFTTLAGLFDAHWSLSAAARSMHIHLNTLKQRVERLRLLLGEEAFDLPESRFRLELAVRAELVRRAFA